jgi:hypothetical protein
MIQHLRRRLPLVVVGCAIGCGAPASQTPERDASSTDASSTLDSGSRDSGDRDSSTDATSVDALLPLDAGNDGGLPEGAVLPHGAQVVASDSISLQGVTSDGYAVYTDTASNQLSAVALSGGPSVSLGNLGANGTVIVTGAVVLYWSASDAFTGVGPLSIWTSAHGVQSLASQSVPYGTAVSGDGANIVFFDAVDFATGITAGDVYVASADGTGKTKLASAIQLQDPFSTAFAGDVAVVSWSVAPVGTAGGATLQTFAAPQWSGITLATGVVDGFSVNPAGTLVLGSTQGGLSVYPVDGGAPTLIDAAGVSGLFTGDGMGVVYVSATNALVRSPIAAPNPMTLVASGFEDLAALSPDGAWALGDFLGNLANPTSTDLLLASATSEGEAQTLSMTANVVLSPNFFTADSSHVIYASDTTAAGLSNFYALPVGGTAPQALGTIWTYYPVGAAKVVFNDHYNPVGGVGTNGVADIEWVDTTQSVAPTLLVSQADANFFTTIDRTQLVYSWSYLADSKAGIWTLAIP